MNIVILTFTGIPSFDYSMPLIHSIKKKKNIKNVYLLSNSLNYKKIFPDFKDSLRILDKLNVQNIDLSCFSYFKFLKFLFKFSTRDFDRSNYIIKTIDFIETKLIKRSKLTIKTLEKLSPDIVFFDHRNPSTIDNYEDMFHYFKKKKIKVYLLPHAPHYLDENEHLSTGLDNNLLNNVNYIEPFKYSMPDKNLTNGYSSVVYLNYPGFDKQWLEILNNNVSHLNSLILLIRPFHTKDSTWNKNEKVILSTGELNQIINAVNLIVELKKYEKVIIKPHPKNYQTDLDKYITSKINHKNVIYYKDSILNLISNTNVYVSTYSTTLLTPIANECPTYIINSEIFDKVFNDWDVLKKLYSNFTGFTEPESILDSAIDTEKDRNHLNAFFDLDKPTSIF